MKFGILIYIFITTFDGGACDRNFSMLSDQCPNMKNPVNIIRKRRYLAFEHGSNVILTIQLVKTYVIHIPSGWNMALEIDVLYPLPDAPFVSKHFRRKFHHRQKRDFWKRIENALETYNYNGKSCILRAICEAKDQFAAPGRSLVHDILRAIFTAPLHEEEFVEEIQDSYNEILEEDFCNKYNDCPLSIVQIILALNKQKY